MIGVTKELTFEAAHRLRFHRGACRNIHGHSYRVRVSVTAGEGAALREEEEATGMVIDFAAVKAALATVLLTGVGYPDGAPRIPFDHALILNARDPILPAISAISDELVADSKIRASQAGGYDPVGDPPLRLITMVEEPTAENMAELLASLVQLVLGHDLAVFRLELWETASSSAVWEG
jgi:6-pyruvoyltetrahydropterin/6-carboxytetrahydropterin synthase